MLNASHSIEEAFMYCRHYNSNRQDIHNGILALGIILLIIEMISASGCASPLCR